MLWWTFFTGYSSNFIPKCCILQSGLSTGGARPNLTRPVEGGSNVLHGMWFGQPGEIYRGDEYPFDGTHKSEQAQRVGIPGTVSVLELRLLALYGPSSRTGPTRRRYSHQPRQAHLSYRSREIVAQLWRREKTPTAWPSQCATDPREKRGISHRQAQSVPHRFFR
jgi:hypothetical protein